MSNEGIFLCVIKVILVVIMIRHSVNIMILKFLIKHMIHQFNDILWAVQVMAYLLVHWHV